MGEGELGRRLNGLLSLTGRRGVVALVAVAVLAFAIGRLPSGGDGDRTDAARKTETEETGHDHSASSREPTIWTCAMHPQIRLPKPGKCPICFMDLIPLISRDGDTLGPRRLRLSDAARALARIQTTPARRAFAEAEIRMVGRITYDETRVAYITAWVPGRLDKLFADYTGMTVNKGDHLVHIYSPELIAAQQELIEAHVAWKELQKTESVVLRTTAEATLEAAREKLRLFGLTTAQVQAIEATHKTSDHLTIYAPIGGVVVHKDALEGMYVKTGTRIYTIADLSELWVMFEAYESDLPWLRYGQKVEFTSPSFPGEHFDAVISFIDPLVDPATRTVKIRAVVDNKKRLLKPDMFVSGVVKSRLDSRGNIISKRLAGKWISPMHPEIVKGHPGQCDICGMDLVPASSLGYVDRPLDESDAPILIPASAPLITGERAVVYIDVRHEDGSIFEGREIELGPRAGDYYVVKSGISEGELVVSNGAFKIDSELQIQAKPSMMSPAGGAAPPGHHHGASPAPATSAGGSGGADGAATSGAHSPHGGAPTSPAGEGAAVTPEKESDAVRAALMPVYRSYLTAQTALADDDLAAAKKAAGDLSASIKSVDMSIFSHEGHVAWMRLSADASAQAGEITGAKDLTSARGAFYSLSDAVIRLHNAFGHSGDGDYYLTFCPMARDGEGAYWLQTEGVVRNPYFGGKMPRCGSFKDTLAASTGSVK